MASRGDKRQFVIIWECFSNIYCVFPGGKAGGSGGEPDGYIQKGYGLGDNNIDAIEGRTETIVATSETWTTTRRFRTLYYTTQDKHQPGTRMVQLERYYLHTQLP
jgi:hypothetical protein